MATTLHAQQPLYILQNEEAWPMPLYGLDKHLEQSPSRVPGPLFFPRTTERLAGESPRQHIVGGKTFQKLGHVPLMYWPLESCPVNQACPRVDVVGPKRFQPDPVRREPKAANATEEFYGRSQLRPHAYQNQAPTLKTQTGSGALSSPQSSLAQGALEDYPSECSTQPLRGGRAFLSN